ncbi:MBOAT family protein [Bradyrhizobium liaoningense]|uniref:MBOAT family O-acyltransferase n=1 Tax=Bradyrhizobium liaoningense TaxID=43992 RepID=UPI001BABB634|nr:MBOAT family protein [Bradyrhizobium liaoningense]MBR0735492.1 MBOAT family protein [Bradyrhizobium liaoningense]
MNYTESLFIFAFAIVVLVALALRPWPVARQWFLTAFSLFVIATWGVYSLVLFLMIGLSNFAVARALYVNKPPVSTAILATAVIVDVGLLAIFKYVKPSWLHNGWLPEPIGIPLAISFYTFHIISYLVDIHRGRTLPVGFGQYLFYLGFFPHVVAGPIVRTWQLIPQLRNTRRIAADWPMGLHFMVTGFFLKSICADNIAGIIDPAWKEVALTATDRWLVAFLYYCQIYGDFAGYSLMALGMARLLGFRLPANFRSPLRAIRLQEFWRRWHITLSRWLRDYLYIPLGGNRSGFVLGNLILTMLLGGLWHGSGAGFVIWGALHGLGLVFERLVPIRNVLLSWFLTQAWVTLAWVPFRLPQWRDASAFLSGMVTSPLHMPSGSILFGAVFAAPVIVHQFLPLLISRIGRRRLPIILGAMTGVLAIADLIVAAPSKVFLYFAF